MPLLGKKPDPKEQVREWRGKLRKEQRVIDRQIRGIQTEENKVKKSIKEAAKKGQKDVAKILAKELVQSRKAVGKLYASKAQMNSVMMTMQQQVSMQRMVGAIGKSTEVMQAMQSLIKVPEISQVMLELSKEMTKAGMIEEILEETFEDLEDDDVEELADKEVEKVLWEVTTGQLGQLSGTPSATPQDDGAVGPEPEAVESDEEEDMTARLEALRS
ncbi:Charged multivesicular body protein 3 [Geodia barretti]|uniref:Charged multivesicular body protein 3 n=2 Tax=Geodia barretti TaxID=519541 RepID=A0AA35U1M5_GEOBA|nr:Charged multivesicular body protein 3 [Geodia barretti]